MMASRQCMWSWTLEQGEIFSKFHPSRPCSKTDTYYTDFMNWNAEENLLTSTANMA